MAQKNNILLAFYGDDFTGSTDALEAISKAGAKAILFTDPPTQEQLNQFPDIDAYGIAGKTRALNPTEMEADLLPAFQHIKESGARHVHYKVCSTFDSSPTIGSIGKAIDCGATIFKNKIIPVLGGHPTLGRYCVFGNLFALMGIGSQGNVYRLDRHPSMSKHPVAPMNEADLKIHLSKQTSKSIALIDYVQQQKPLNEWITNEEVILLDATNENELLKIGEWMNNLEEQQFSVGGSSVEMAFGKYWNHNKILIPKTEYKPIEKVNPFLVVSGSCSPVTKAQIEFAKANGSEEIIIDAVKICNDEILEEEITIRIDNYLQQQKNVIVHTGEKQTNNLSSEKLGTTLGLLAKHAVEKNKLQRVIVAGGDTSSYAARAMEIDAVEIIASIVVGAPLCKAYSKNKNINGLQINFKGGQVGSENYFTLF
ncbi:MAG: four-carbon acid sugar kinase family protein [Ferruginibacter sp.]|nr:four-carbon acid sugar kinase family protein [Ferruginibacter sp.]